MSVTYQENRAGKAALLKTPGVAAIVSQCASSICAEANSRARTPHGQGIPYRMKTYTNSEGFPHAGVWTATVYACNHERKHGTLANIL